MIKKEESNQTKSKHLDKSIAKGAGVNFIGIMAKSLHPVFLILITRLYGPAIVGIYIFTVTILEIIIRLSTAGYKDGIIMYISRYAGSKNDKENIYIVMANSVIISMSVAFLFLLLIYLCEPLLVFLKVKQEEMIKAIKILAIALPFMVLPDLIISATKSLMIMKYETIINGFLKPFMLLILASIIYLLNNELSGLLIAYILTNVILTIFACFIFVKYFSIKKLFYAIFHFKFFLPLTSFAIPQSMNMTFNHFISGIDIIMLGFFGIKSEFIAFYAVGAQLVRNIRQVKLGFSGIFSPLIARLYKENQISELEQNFYKISRWATIISIPIIFTIIIFRQEFLLIFHSTYTYNSYFMIILVLNPFLSCAFGLAGNIIVMTGHSKWNLLNSFIVAGLNIVLNLILIPIYGYLGAAVATIIAGSVITIAQLIEVKYLIKIRIKLQAVYKPILSGLLAILCVNLFYNFIGSDEIIYKISAFVISIVIYFTCLLLLKLDIEDKGLILSFFKKDKGNNYE